MSRYLLIILILTTCFSAKAQETDSNFAAREAGALAIIIKSKPGESVAMLAARYFTTVEKIEAASMVDGKRKLDPGTRMVIPLGKENFLPAREPSGMAPQEQIYYRVKEKDNVALIALLAGMQKPELVLWNSLHGNSLQEGQALFIGWIKKVPRDSTNLRNGVAYPSTRIKRSAPTVDTAKHPIGELDSLYNVQTQNGINTIAEKGTAVFFEKAGNNKIYYAFHATTARGTVIKVTNPGTSRTIYVKVLGPIPDTKLYANSVIGICSNAKEALGINDSKAWVELTYSPNQ